MTAAAVSPDPSPSDLAEAADANFVAHAGWLQRRLPGMEVAEEDLVRIDSGLPCDTFNVVCRARLDPRSAAERVRETVDHFGGAGRPFSWWVGPADRPAELGEILAAAGLEKAETELAMAADLSELPAGGAVVPGLRVERVASPRAVADFARVQAENWNPPDPNVRLFYRLACAALLSADCPMRLYVGYAGEEPVAAAELTLGGGVAGLYNVATRKEWRRRGFGSALTFAPLLEAKENGCRTAVLQAAPDGVRIYERVGFRKFGNVTEYKPRT